METVKCPICESVGLWKNVDQYRLKPAEMAMCTKCGFVTYPGKVAKAQEVTEFYKEEYREPPTFNNICTGERKLHYHGAFLAPLFQEWAKKGLKEPVVTEIGAAFGMFLDWLRNIVPGAKVHGTELTTSFVRNAHWLYGLNLTDAIDTSKKYDLIASYKVAEHIPGIDEELKKYASCLAPSGKLYISIPAWFGTLHNFGAEGFSLEYYYHTNHINVWSRNHFEILLARLGFKVISENHTFYDDTYLCELSDAPLPIGEFDGPEKTEEWLKKIYVAAMAYEAGDYERAVAEWPNFPQAHYARYEGARAKHHARGFEWIEENIIHVAISACPESSMIRAMGGDICMRYGQWEKGLKYLDQALKMRPNDPAVLMNMAHCYRYMAELASPADKLKFLESARKLCMFVHGVSQQMRGEALTLAMQDNAKIPTPLEPVKNPT